MGDHPLWSQPVRLGYGVDVVSFLNNFFHQGRVVDEVSLNGGNAIGGQVKQVQNLLSYLVDIAASEGAETGEGYYGESFRKRWRQRKINSFNGELADSLAVTLLFSTPKVRNLILDLGEKVHREKRAWVVYNMIHHGAVLAVNYYFIWKTGGWAATEKR